MGVSPASLLQALQRQAAEAQSDSAVNQPWAILSSIYQSSIGLFKQLIDTVGITLLFVLQMYRLDL